MINGLPDNLPTDDAIACAEMLVALKRAVPPAKWIESAAPAAIPEGLI